MPHRLKKYFVILKTGIQDSFEYRSEIFIGLIGWGIRFLISIYLFSALFQDRTLIGTYDFKGIMIYFLLVQILTSLLFTRTGMNIANDIQLGDFSNYMMKPMSYIWYYVLKELGQNLNRFGISSGIFGVVIAFYKPDFFSWDLIQHLPSGLISVLIGYLISSFLNMSIGILGFWIINARRLIFMFFAVMSIFSGMMIPITLFPENFQKILFLTPFPYILHVPISFLLGHYSRKEGLSMILMQILMALMTFILIKFLFYFGIKKYESVGR